MSDQKFFSIDLGEDDMTCKVEWSKDKKGIFKIHNIKYSMPNKQPLEWETELDQRWKNDSIGCFFASKYDVKSFIHTVREEAYKAGVEDTMKKVVGALPEECPADYNGYDMFNECRSQFLSNLKSKELI